MADSFAQLLRRYRIKAGLSQEQLAARAGVSSDTISVLERGVRRAPYKATLDLLIAAMGLDENARREIEEAANRGRVRRSHEQEIRSNNLPLQLSSFVDREQEVARIKELLASHRLVTLVGTGGAGKTRSALRIAGELLDDFTDGVWLAELAPISDPALVTTTIARALNIQQTPNRPIIDTLLSALKRKHLLLVLDNCEHVIDEARSIVAAILRSSPDIHILATSRESFGVAGERVYRMPSLPVPPAVQLFSDRAASVDSDFRLSAEITPHIAEICRRLDGIPLAIELAAARITVLSPTELVRRLDERFHVLTAGDRSALPRHQTMRALIDWSYDLLSSDERRLFRKLSIFAGDFTLDLVIEVCRYERMNEITVLDLLSSLVEKSLVHAEANERRYRLLESIREYARGKLVDAGEASAVSREHARACLSLAEQLRDAWETALDREWLTQVTRQFENFEAALGWAFGERGDAVLGVQLVAALSEVWRFFPIEGRRWVHAAEQHLSVDTPASVLADLDLTEAAHLSMLGQHKASLPYAKRALVRYADLADALGIAKAKQRVGIADVFLGNVANGEAVLREALDEYRTLGALRSQIPVLQSLALARRFAGDLDGARRLFAEALAAGRAVGTKRNAAYIATNLAETEFRAGDPAAAVRIAEEALVLGRAVGDTRIVVNALYNMAAYMIVLHRYDEARAAAHEALTGAHDMQWSVGVAFTLQHLAATYEDRRRAARMLGFVDARLTELEAVREYTEQQEYDAVLPALRRALGEDELARLMSEGSRWSEEHAVAEAAV